MKRREYYMWLRWCRLPLTISVEPLRFTVGLAFYRCTDGSGRHSHCYRAEIVLPVLRFTTVLTWGPRPIPPKFNLSDVQGFGDIGGYSLAKRHKVLSGDDEDED